MKSRDPFNDALTALTAFAGTGRFGWGEPLVVTALAAELGLSPTPVREALARLSGEGLIEHRPGRGYHAPSPSADDIEDLYEMHRRLVHWALDLIDRDVTRWTAGPVDGASVERVFTALARAAGHAFLAQAHWRATLQLRPVRLVEDRLEPEASDWLVRAIPLVVARDVPALRQEIDAYHHDRKACSAGVVAAMRQHVKSIDQI